MKKLCLDEPGYAFPMQFWPQVAAAELRVTELPVRLIYNDPTRHFGGQLDDADNRLRHYLDVFQAEVFTIGEQPFVNRRPEHSCFLQFRGDVAGELGRLATDGISERTRTLPPLASKNSAVFRSDLARNLSDHSGAGVVNRQTPPELSRRRISCQKEASL